MRLCIQTSSHLSGETAKIVSEMYLLVVKWQSWQWYLFHSFSLPTTGTADNTGRSLSIFQVSIPVVGISDNATVNWCFMPSLWIICKSYSSKRKRHLAKFLVASTRLTIHLEVWWSAWLVKWVPSRYVRSKKTAHTTGMHSWWVVSRFYLALSRTHGQHPVGFVIPSSSACRKMQPSSRLHVWVSRVNASFCFGCVRNCGEINFS